MGKQRNKMKIKLLLAIFCFLYLTVFGQSDELIFKNQLTINEKTLNINVEVTNLRDGNIFINTNNFYVTSSFCDSLCSGLGVSLKSQYGELINYNYPMIFIQSKSLRREINRSKRVNKRHQPKIKITPKRKLLIKKDETRKIIVKIPLKYWLLNRGDKYIVTLHYNNLEDQEESEEILQLSNFKIRIGTFTY